MKLNIGNHLYRISKVMIKFDIVRSEIKIQNVKKS